jgi:hypothetical protein
MRVEVGDGGPEGEPYGRDHEYDAMAEYVAEIPGE